MPRAQGCAGAAHVQDERYAAGAGMRRSGACSGRTVCRGRRDAHDCRDAGGRVPRVGALGDAGAVTEERRMFRTLSNVATRVPHPGRHEPVLGALIRTSCSRRSQGEVPVSRLAGWNRVEKLAGPLFMTFPWQAPDKTQCISCWCCTPFVASGNVPASDQSKAS
jgi:hypothetical protein